jgi:hypothetical protein
MNLLFLIMKHTIACLLLIIANNCYAQLNPNYLYPTYNAKNNTTGIKDYKGNYFLKPKEYLLINTTPFKEVIGIIEPIKEKDSTKNTKDYYLNKNGKVFGIDSIYISDFTIDKEQEGYLRFRDRKTQLVGYFNKDGQVVVPALYNEATRFYNGLALVVKNGTKKCMGDHNEEDCEHYTWEGEKLLIDTKNNIVAKIDSTVNLDNIDWYTLTINPNHKAKNSIDINGINGNKLNFLDINYQFENWFRTVFSKAVQQQQLETFCYNRLIISNSLVTKLNKKNTKASTEYFYTTGQAKPIIQNNKLPIYKLINNFLKKDTSLYISTEQDLIMFEEEMPLSLLTNEKYFYGADLLGFTVHILQKDNRLTNSLKFLKYGDSYRLYRID